MFIFKFCFKNKLYTCSNGRPTSNNSHVYGSNWYCNEGYKKSGHQCESIFADIEANQQTAMFMDQIGIAMRDTKSGHRCVSIFADIGSQPANSYVYGSNWYCNEGYKKSGHQCESIFADIGANQQTAMFMDQNGIVMKAMSSQAINV